MPPASGWLWAFRARPVRTIDGDTIVVEVDLGFWLRNTVHLRLAGVNAPELHGASRPAGLAAQAFVADWLAAVDPHATWPLSLLTSKADAFDRWLAVVTRQGDPLSLNDALLASGHAVVYHRRSA